MSDPLEQIAARLLARDPSPLVPGTVCDAALTHAIDALAAPAPVKIGLHLLNDDLESVHPLAQAGGGDGLMDYWHAVIHRREGDYSNARYWLARIGLLPLLAEVYGPDPAAPGAFVAKCQAIGRGRDAESERFQRGELARLLEHVRGHIQP